MASGVVSVWGRDDDAGDLVGGAGQMDAPAVLRRLRCCGADLWAWCGGYEEHGCCASYEPVVAQAARGKRPAAQARRDFFGAGG